MSNVNNAYEDLGTAWRQFQSEYGEVREGWRDAVMEHFEKHYFEEIDASIPSLLSAMEEFCETVAQARVALED